MTITATTILLVDDQALVRSGMRALIERSEPGARICETGSAEEARRLLQDDPFDVVFLDIDLKQALTGLDLLAGIRSAGLPCRVIMLSAHSDETTVLNCIRAGAAGYICKDMEDQDLFRRALDTIFAGSVFLPPEVLGRGAVSVSPISADQGLAALG